MLRKLWTAKLGEWLFGSGVALACLVPVVARPSVAAGFFDCAASSMEPCTNVSTGEPCQTVPGDPTKTHACEFIPGDIGRVRVEGVQCPPGCALPDGSSGGTACSANNSCYY